MCNTSNSPSFKERVQCYINKKKEIEVEYKSRMEALNKEAFTDILTNCPIKVGDVYAIGSNNAWSTKRQYYKVGKLEAKIDGTVSAYGHKSKLDGTWGKRDNNYMFTVSIFSDYNVVGYTKVDNYVERTKD